MASERMSMECFHRTPSDVNNHLTLYNRSAAILLFVETFNLTVQNKFHWNECKAFCALAERVGERDVRQAYCVGWKGREHSGIPKQLEVSYFSSTCWFGMHQHAQQLQEALVSVAPSSWRILMSHLHLLKLKRQRHSTAHWIHRNITLPVYSLQAVWEL